MMNQTPEATPQAPNDSVGYLTVRAYTAGEALPVEGATLTVSDGGDGTLTEDIVRVTDRSGRTEIIALPTPPASLSRSPSDIRPYAVYNLRVTHPNFYPFTAMSVPVFSGIVSVQPVNMVPLSRYETSDRQPNEATTVRESETLWSNAQKRR